MRRRSKILAFALAVLMIVGVLPLSVFVAADDSDISSNANSQTHNEPVGTQGGSAVDLFDEWVEIAGKKYYYDIEGKLASGYTAVHGANYYFDPDTNVMLVSGWATVYGVPMFFGADGKAADGIVKNTALTEVDGYLENTGCFDSGVPVSGEVTDGQFKYVFEDGKLVSKTEIDTENPEILVRVIKDGNTSTFYLKAESKKFEAFDCYTVEMYGFSSDGTPVKLNVTDNTLVIPNEGGFHTFEVRYIPAHSYVRDAQASQLPTCRADGYDTLVCSVCGNSRNEVVKANGEHVYGEWEVIIEATCSHEGLKERKCGCGARQTESIDRDPENHKIVYDPASSYYYEQAATCTERGYRTGICEWCGERAVEYTEDALGHDYENVQWSVKEPANCVKVGTKEGLCGRGCGATVYMDYTAPDYHKNGINGTITNQADEREHFVLFNTVVRSTCATAGKGVFICLDCGGFINDVVLDLDKDNHEWGEKYLAVIDDEGKLVETVKIVEESGVKYVVSYDKNGDEINKVVAPAEITDATFIENSKFGCVYSGEWRRDCTNSTCVDEHGARIYDPGEKLEMAHLIDMTLGALKTTIDINDPLYGMHYYVCTKCDRAIYAKAHEMSVLVSNGDGTHTVYCKDGCKIETEGASFGDPYSVIVDCDYEIVKKYNGNDVIGHVEQCACGHEVNFVDHATVQFVHVHSGTEHYKFCEVCGHKEAIVLSTVLAQTATCWQIGWAAYSECACGYNDRVVINQLPHEISATIVKDSTGHYYKCENCDYKHRLESHSMVEVLGSAATCDTPGVLNHWECSVCGWYDAALYPDGVVTDKLEHVFVGAYDFNASEHWQFCSLCSAIVRNAHTYNNDANFNDYDDEAGTADHKCDTCNYEKKLEGLETWYGALGLRKEGSDYYLYINEVKMTDYLAKLSDGSFRYFDNDGKLVMTLFDNGKFDKITEFGHGTLTDLITYPGYNDTKAAQRGAIKNAIIETNGGIIIKIENGKLVTPGWLTIDGRDYYFNSEGVLVKSNATSGNLTITAPKYNSDELILVNVREDGSRLLGVVPNGDGTVSYYLDGTAGKLIGRIEDNYYNVGKIYFADANGALYSGEWVSVDGVYYSFDTVDYYMTAWHIDSYNPTLDIYTDGEGKKITTGWYLAKGVGGRYIEGGIMLKNKDNYPIDGTYYKIDADGVVSHYNGWIDDDHYVSNGMIVMNRREHIGGEYYLFDGEGLLVKATTGSDPLMVYYEGWAYAIDVNGVMDEAYDAQNGSIWVHFMINGKVSETDKGYYTNTGLIKNEVMEIDGVSYTFDENGIATANE
ncbi:MAG: hypothetical protein IKB51_04705 [Clostridia bacterium]|nr:hypothetical protein [Clostridia bacterium]